MDDTDFESFKHKNKLSGSYDDRVSLMATYALSSMVGTDQDIERIGRNLRKLAHNRRGNDLHHKDQKNSDIDHIVNKLNFNIRKLNYYVGSYN